MKNKGEFGFILLEAAIFIIILGISTGLVASIYKSLKYSSEIAITQQNKQVITRMLVNYLLEHSRFPRASNNASDGTEQPELYSGYVPYKTIGIQKKSTLDGSGRPIRYIVEESFTQTDSLSSNQGKLSMGEKQSFCEIDESRIKIVDQRGISVSDSPICFVLLTNYADHPESTSNKKFIDNGTIHWVTKSFLSAIYANFACIND